MSQLKVKPLVVVPCHAVYVGKSKNDAEKPTSWLGSYVNYKNNEEPVLYIEHIRYGVQLSLKENAVLMFSGGQTRKVTELSEASSYFTLSQQLGLTDKIECDLEPYARDSFENMLFSIYRYKAQKGVLPEVVHAVGFSFKSVRFQFHFETIVKNKDVLFFPEIDCTFKYHAVNDPPQHVLNTSRTDEKKTLQAFYKAPFGDSGILLEKRNSRDPWNVKIPYPFHV